MEIRQLVREFHYNGVTLPEVSSTMSVEEVRTAYTPLYPEIATAAIEGPETVAGKLVYKFFAPSEQKGDTRQRRERVRRTVTTVVEHRTSHRLARTVSPNQLPKLDDDRRHASGVPGLRLPPLPLFGTLIYHRLILNIDAISTRELVRFDEHRMFPLRHYKIFVSYSPRPVVNLDSSSGRKRSY